MGRNKYIEIKETTSNTGKKVWCIINNKLKVTIGIIYFYSPWHKYVFGPGTETIWDCECLKDIIKFIEKINKKS